jgi:hypothetical protein
MAKTPICLLRSGRAVLATSPPRKKKDGRLTSGSPIAPQSQGQASFVAGELTTGFPRALQSQGQASFVAGELTSGFPNATQSQGQADFERTSGSPITPLSTGQANFGVVGQTSRWPCASPGQAQKAMRVRVGEKDRMTSEESVAQSSLVFEAGTPVMPQLQSSLVLGRALR